MAHVCQGGRERLFMLYVGSDWRYGLQESETSVKKGMRRQPEGQWLESPRSTASLDKLRNTYGAE